MVLQSGVGDNGLGMGVCMIKGSYDERMFWAYVEGAFMARDNARRCRAYAKQYDAAHQEWADAAMQQAHQAFERAYDWLEKARTVNRKG